MSTIRVEKKSFYTVISNIPLQKDKRLSAKAKGIITVMLSFPDDWNWSIEELSKYFSDGKESIRTGIKELESYGYILREKQERSQGKLGKTNYILYEEPQDEINRSEAGLTENKAPSTEVIEAEEVQEVLPVKVPKNPKHPEEIEAIITYLNETIGTNYKTTTKATTSLIEARLKEGFTVDDFKTVIWRKAKQWMNDPKMVQYLRPKTLFGNKFEGYLNERDSFYPQREPEYTNQNGGLWI